MTNMRDAYDSINKPDDVEPLLTWLPTRPEERKSEPVNEPPKAVL